MAEVDTSFYKQPQVNPLDGIAKVVGVVGGLNQNKLFQQTYEARDKVGQAYSAATNPDGTVDEQKLRALIGQSGFGAGEATAQAIGNTTANFNLNKARNDYIVGTLGAASNNPNLSPQSVVGTILTLGRNAAVPSEMIHSVTRELLTNPAYKNPEKLRDKLSEFQNIVLGAGGAQRVAGPPDPLTRAPTSVPLAATGPKPQKVGLPPGEGEGAVAAAAPSAALLAQHRADSSNYRRQVFPLEQAIPALERLGTKGTGPTTDEINQLKSAAISFGFAPKKWEGTVKDFDEAKKYLTDWVRANGDNSTNDKLAASFSSNASVNISNAAAQDVAKAALSLRRMQQAQTMSFEASGLPESDYAKWASKWNSRQDPRVYGFDLMKPAQRKAVLSSLPPAKRDAFMLDVQRAEEAGVLNPPGSNAK